MPTPALVGTHTAQYAGTENGTSGTPSQQATQRQGGKGVRLDPTSGPLAERGRGWAHTGRKKETKWHQEKHVRLEGGEKPGPVNLFLRISSCHLMYCRRSSFWSSSDGSSTPTLGSSRRERECDREHKGARSSGHRSRTTPIKEQADSL